ncbi:MAG TPA: family 16 glycosylhydrolase [Pedobacter sp.]|uniref:family 16 glycosylhydrolase n=1 Tax=Pedobacter sp. TaxID=1411316 RepID=UPI002BC4E879|nr:family 16 glycosylhydrolase [Pedobacter sp.]HMI01702.1 family 16 glycosylhydrolase [Pedobacter sp.]
MNKITLGLLIGMSLFTLSCKKSAQDAASQQTDDFSANTKSQSSASVFSTSAVDLANYTLTLEDNFDGVGPLHSRWNYRAENTVRGYATILRSNVTYAVSGAGILRMAARENSTAPLFTASQISTQNSFLQKYGYFECRVLVNRTIGPHCAFWLQSPTYGNTNDPGVSGTEIDIFEHHMANGPNIARHNLHWNGYGADHQTIGTTETVSGLQYGFHTFGLEWTSSEYIFYVDGVEKWRTSTAISHTSEYLIFSQEITGYGGDRFAGTYPDFMDIDWVRAYKTRKVSVFQNCTYKGWAKQLATANYTMAQLAALGVTNDAISSVSVPAGIKIQLYQGDNFTGSSITLTADNSCLIDEAFNDNISSVKVSAN